MIKNSEEVVAEITPVNTQEEVTNSSTPESEIEFIVTNESSSNEVVNEEEPFVITNVTEVTESLEEEMTMEVKVPENLTAKDMQKLEREERIRMAQERIKKLKDITV